MNKTFSIFKCMLLGAVICVLPSCVQTIDDINTDAELDMAVGLPVGTVSLKLGDFLGKMGEDIKSGDNFVYNGKHYDGVLLWQHDFTRTRDFHPVDLKDYISNTSEQFFIKDAVEGLSSPITTSGTTLTFPMKVTLTGVNSDADEERLDSMIISSAKFTSTISTENLPDLTIDKISKVEIVLGNQFSRKKGKRLEIENFTSQGFNKPIDIEVDDFSINLMKNPNLVSDKKKDYDNNVNKELDFDVVFTLKDGNSISFDSNSNIKYIFNVEFLNYDALYGFFNPSKDMIDRDHIDIAKEWDGWSDVKSLELFAAEPIVEVDITTSVAAPLVLDIDTFCVFQEGGDRHFATFNSAGTQIKLSENLVNRVKVSDPLDEVAVNTIPLDYRAERGNLDYLLNVRPDYIYYKYIVSINSLYPVSQHRLVNNTAISWVAHITLPLIFNEGTNLSYQGVLEDLDWSGISLDSLVSNTDILDSITKSNVVLYLTAENTIPMDVKLSYKFFDKDDKEVSLRDLILNSKDTIVISAPTSADNEVRNSDKTLSVTNGGKSQIVINVDKDEVEKLSTIKTMKYTATIKTNKESFAAKSDGSKANQVEILEKSGLKLHIGAAAQLGAQMNLNFLNDNE